MQAEVAEPTHAQELGGHVNEFIDSLKGAIVSGMAAAAESVQMDAEVARVMTRMAAFHAVLEAIDAQKNVVVKAIENAASDAQKASLRLQLTMLDNQTVSVLERSGVAPKEAKAAVQQIEHHSHDQSRNGAGEFEEDPPKSNGHNARRRVSRKKRTTAKV